MHHFKKKNHFTNKNSTYLFLNIFYIHFYDCLSVFALFFILIQSNPNYHNIYINK